MYMFILHISILALAAALAKAAPYEALGAQFVERWALNLWSEILITLSSTPGSKTMRRLVIAVPRA